MRLVRVRSRLGSGVKPRLIPMAKVARNHLFDYRSPEWIALRKSRIGDRDWVAAKARAKPGERLVLDHVVEIRDGGAALDPQNTEWLTFSEHQAKTERAKRKRVGLV